jgi:subfamily B ATP-binding cassette protein MsbA
MHVVLSFGIGLAIWFGSYLILNGTITSGAFVSFLAALIMLYTPMKSMGSTYNSVLMSFMAIERVFSKLENIPEIQKTGTILLLNDFQGIRSRILKE